MGVSSIFKSWVRQRSRMLICLYLLCATSVVLWLVHNYSFRIERFERNRHPYLMHAIEQDYREKHTYPRIIEQLKDDRKNLQFPDAVQDIADSIKPRNKSILPTIYAVTATYARPVQKAELTRIKQTFLHVRNFHWIVVEDANRKSSLVIKFLRNSGMKYTHLNKKTSLRYKLRKGERRTSKPRGVEQKNTAIEWLIKNVDIQKNPGVLYFADDDNTYDIRIFEEMRNTQNVSVWPVAFVGGRLSESPRVDRKTGRVTGWNVSFDPRRPFAIDMAGFAINLKLLQEKPDTRINANALPGHQESSLLEQLVKMEDLEPKADMCTKVYVWHTRTENPNLMYHIKETAEV